MIDYSSWKRKCLKKDFFDKPINPTSMKNLDDINSMFLDWQDDLAVRDLRLRLLVDFRDDDSLDSILSLLEESYVLCPEKEDFTSKP